MIPEIRYDFNFDYILVMIFIAYIIYGYFSGGHKQIRLSINLVLPFAIIYYLGMYITKYIYLPVTQTIVFQQMVDNDMFGRNTMAMMLSYILTYIVVFTFIFFLSIYARRYILNENMRAKLGVKNNYLGALFALINGYVLIYFIILPVFSMGIVDESSKVTQFVLENPPPFSRIARTAEKAVPIKGLADKAADFQQLLTNDGITGYYNDAIYDYQQLYIGDSGSYEESFMNEVYSNLTDDSKQYLAVEYEAYFGESFSSSNYQGVSRVLVEEGSEGNLVYQQLMILEAAFNDEYNINKDISEAYIKEVATYEQNLLNYQYTTAHQLYLNQLDELINYTKGYLGDKMAATFNGDNFTDEYTGAMPILDLEMPEGYVEVIIEPVEPVETPEITSATAFVEQFSNKVDVTEEIQSYGTNFENHKGLLMWYVDELNREMASTADGGDISNVIVSYKGYYDTITENINDDELQSKLYLAEMSITTYDVFTEWLACTQEHINNVPLEDIKLESNRCNTLNPEAFSDYDFTGEAFDIIKTLFDGESVSWIILQYKYDYEAGIFDPYFKDFPEVQGVLESTKSLVDDYDLYYKDIANSIEGNVSMVIKIGISVMKYNFDVYQTLEDTPMLSAMVNDGMQLCSNEVSSSVDLSVKVCNQTTGEGAFKELFNMRYLAGEVLFKAYLMRNEDNEPIIYDYATMNAFLDKTNDSIENNVFTKESVRNFGDQFAFHVINDETNYTLLEQMFDDGQITIEAMRLLADDEHDLFSEEFRIRVRSLIR